MVNKFAVVLLKPPPKSFTVNPRVYVAEAPVYNKVPEVVVLPKTTALVVFPMLLAPAATTIVLADNVPSFIDVVPVYVFAPESIIVPAPALVTPNPTLIIPLIVRSVAEVPSSFTVKVLVAPKANGAEIVAPFVPVVASVMETSPPRVKVPLPVIEAPVVAPPSSVKLESEPNVKVDNPNIAPDLTVSATLAVLFPFSVIDPEVFPIMIPPVPEKVVIHSSDVTVRISVVLY